MENGKMAEIYTAINNGSILEILKDLNPIESRDKIKLDCPVCGEHEAYYYKNNHVITCNRLNNCGVKTTLWDYVQTNHQSTNEETLLILAQYAGVTVEASKPNDKADRQQALKSAFENMQELLFSEEGKDSLLYLQGRGYTNDIIKLAGFGHIPKKNNYTNSQFGTTHTIAIPILDEFGRYDDIVARTTDPTQEKQYLYRSGSKKRLFGLKSNQTRESTLILCEGIIDAVICQAFNIPIVATGGKITGEQLETIKRMSEGNLQRIICVFDNDQAGKDNTKKIINTFGADLDIYIAELPEGRKDPDEVIRHEGAEALQNRIDNAISCAYWLAELIKDELTDLERGEAIAEAMKTAQSLNAISAGDYLEAVAYKLKIEPANINLAFDEHTRRKQQADKAEILKALPAQLSEAVKAADNDKVTELLKKGVTASQPPIHQVSGVYTGDQALTDLINTPEGLKTGYSALDTKISIEVGAITLIAGRPSHGKTSLLINLCLNMAQADPEGSYYFFSYEESKRAIYVNMISTLANHTINHAKNKGAYINYLKDGADLNGCIIPEIEKAKEIYNTMAKAGRLQLFDKTFNHEDLTNFIKLEKQRNPKMKAVYIDYIQKIPCAGKAPGTRQLELARISQAILETGVRTNTAIILGAQLNRTTTGKNPELSDLREAGDLEQDANMVISIFNPSMTDKPPERKNGEGIPLAITILKGRDSGAGHKAELYFYPETRKIINVNYRQ